MAGAAMATSLQAQTGKTPVPAAAPMKNLTDSFSYSLGMQVANYYKQQGIKNLNGQLIARAISDINAGKKPLLSQGAADLVSIRISAPDQYQRLKENIDKGEKFLRENKKRPEVKTLPSGLQYEVLAQGTGIKPTAVDTFVAHYTGTLVDGTQFETSHTSGQPLVMPVGRVIKGWVEGLQLMNAGSKYKFYIPYDMAYGLNDQGPLIPGGSTLIFEIELIDVKKPAAR